MPGLGRAGGRGEGGGGRGEGGDEGKNAESGETKSLEKQQAVEVFIVSDWV